MDLVRRADSLQYEAGHNNIISAATSDSRRLGRKVHTRYYYIGSLTTPPCTEGVTWNVLNTPLQMSRGQIEAFRTLYPGSNRPVQPLNGRKVMNR